MGAWAQPALFEAKWLYYGLVWVHLRLVGIARDPYVFIIGRLGAWATSWHCLGATLFQYASQ